MRICRNPLSCKARFDSATPTNPTGIPITNDGERAPSSTSLSKTSNAVGALPINTTGGGSCVDRSLQAFSIPAAVRVEPSGATSGAHSKTVCTADPRVRRAIGTTAAAAMAVSVRMDAPCCNAVIPRAQAASLQCSSGPRERSPLLCTKRSSTCCSSGGKPVSPRAIRMRRMLSVKIGWSWVIHAIIGPCRSI